MIPGSAIGLAADEEVEVQESDTPDAPHALRQSRFSRFRATWSARDWVGVCIEILIVALGVLLAFRVEQWGEQRKRSAEEHDFVERFYRENGQSIRELRAVDRLHSRTVEELKQAIRAKAQPATLASLARREGFGCWMMQVPAATYSNTASQELVGSGRLSLVQDAELRADIRSLAAAQSEGAARVAYSREITQLFSPYLHRYHQLSLGDAPEPICFVDWSSLMNDQAAATAIVRTYRAHVLAQQNRRDLLRESERVQGSLACALAKPDCPRSRS